MHESTFEYLKPTDEQIEDMDVVRKEAKIYAAALDRYLPEGPDKTYTIRKLREVAMWANIAIIRQADGAPR